MKKRYIKDGFIVIVEDYITSVNFVKHDIEGNNKVRVYRNISENIITVSYSTGATLNDLPKKSIMFKVVSDNLDSLITVEGKIIPEQTVIVNGLEYIMSDTYYKTINVYRLHNTPEFNMTNNRIGIYKHNLYIGLIDSRISEWSIKDYIDFLTSSNVIYIDVINESKFSISNLYGIEFDNKYYEYKDYGIMGLNREFYLNDTMIIADFIRQLRLRYPEIQFYTREEDKDSTKYNEWINYKIRPSEIKSNSSYSYTSHVRISPSYGRIWKNGIDVEFEHSMYDLPSLMARRDQFRVGKFLNNDRVFSYNINDMLGDKFDVRYTVFWERDSNEAEYKTATSQDDTGYSMFSYTYKAHIQYVNLENGFYDTIADVVDSVKIN